ncbi:hypothetical protein AVEN_1880-1 [Araneus ventricosus]|uniref:Uncharacterized protein n=1 Tax=Araneus ventricosus TaxID=182803 RepID=A0A4Y2RQY9_ARAVE|nr:hypothetical protein AVEN_1880-1 [Araneus ventricosus]
MIRNNIAETPFGNKLIVHLKLPNLGKIPTFAARKRMMCRNILRDLVVSIPFIQCRFLELSLSELFLSPGRKSRRVSQASYVPIHKIKNNNWEKPAHPFRVIYSRELDAKSFEA